MSTFWYLKKLGLLKDQSFSNGTNRDRWVKYALLLKVCIVIEKDVYNTKLIYFLALK